MNKNKSNTYSQIRKWKGDWSDKKIYLIPYRMLKFYVRHGKIVEKVHEITSFKQCKWLEKYISFNTQKRNQAVKEFEKDFFKILINAVYEKTMESVRTRVKI